MDSFQGLASKSPYSWHRYVGGHVNQATRHDIDHSASVKIRDKSAKESWELIEDLALYDNESWNDPRDFVKPVKAISLPQDVPSTSDRHLVELENQVQRLMGDHLALKPSVQVINDRMIGALPSDTVKNPKLNVNSTSLVSSAQSYPMKDPQSSSNPFNSVNVIKTWNKVISHRNREKRRGICREAETLGGLLRHRFGKRSYVPLVVGRGFLATTSAIIDCNKSKIAVGEGITRSIFGVKEIGLVHEDTPYWTTIARRKSYEARPSMNDISARPPYYLEKDFMDNHIPGK
ncbi:hypothetical protein Tco_1149511 [Tanacetum coccineum]